MNKYLLATALLLTTIITQAKITMPDSTAARKPKMPVYKFYMGSSVDGAIFSTATIQYPTARNPLTGAATATSTGMGTLRFSWFFNFGTTFNFNLSRHIGIYTGIDIKNVGFIESPDGVTLKRRTYNIGAPIGIKIGNMALKHSYFFMGAGADIPFNYKEKSFTFRSQKTKLNEWFSDRTPHVMPYVFAGFAVRHGATMKVQYYPNNFLNPDYMKKGVYLYNGYDVHLLLVSLGMGVPGTGHHSKTTIKS